MDTKSKNLEVNGIEVTSMDDKFNQEVEALVKELYGDRVINMREYMIALTIHKERRGKTSPVKVGIFN